MGRPYANQLALLGATYQWAGTADVSAITASVDALRARPLLVVGSGGSLSVAAFAARLHETHARLPARALTPLEFIRNPVPQSAGVLFLSAAGKNPDMLAAAAHGLASEYSLVVGLCTRMSTPLKAFLNLRRHASVFEFEGPAPKDGFLATNSLLLSCSLLARAYRLKLPPTLPALDVNPSLDDSNGSPDAIGIQRRTPAGSWDGRSSPALGRILNRPNVIVLADGWATPAAIDLESKWAESGFGTVVVTDARNFAHGRHHGLARRLRDTLVLGLAVAEAGDPRASADDARTGSPDDDVLARTLALLPQTAAVATVRSRLGAEAGSLDLLVRVIHLAGEIGRQRGVDPGRPHVAAFGRKLYHAGVAKSLLQSTLREGGYVEDLWIRRKVTASVWAGATDKTRDVWRERCRAWVCKVESTRVGGLVLDYDGTICEADERFGVPGPAIGSALIRLLDAGMLIGVASGRGDSVLAALRAALPERAWPGVIVGMYNGAVCCRLNDAMPKSLPSAAVVEAHAILSGSPAVLYSSRFTLRPTQLTIQQVLPLPEGLLHRFVLEALDAAPTRPAVSVQSSAHSIDVIGCDTSKLRVVATINEALANSGNRGLAIMTVGDQGQADGNDAAFLAHTLGLSVEHAASTFDGCWNVAPRGTRGTAALLAYLGALRPDRNGGFRWSTRRASEPLREGGRRGPTPRHKARRRDGAATTR